MKSQTSLLPARRTRIASLVIASAVLALAVGCQSGQPADTVRAPATPGADQLPAWKYPNIVVFQGLEYDLVMDEPEVREASDLKPYRIRVPVRSIADVELHLQYRVLFYDDERRPIGRDPHWQNLDIPPRAKRHIARTSPKNNTAEWVVEIRRR